MFFGRQFPFLDCNREIVSVLARTLLKSHLPCDINAQFRVFGVFFSLHPTSTVDVVVQLSRFTDCGSTILVLVVPLICT